MGTLIPPRALLLDFGGVVVQTERRSGWAGELAAEIHLLLTAAGCTQLESADVQVDLLAGAAADKQWKNAMSRPFAPLEMTHARFWCDFVAADWPEQAQAVVRAHATALAKRMGELRQVRTARNGLGDLLRSAAGSGVPVAVVSNALSGAVHRDWMAANGWDKYVALQLYSDELGVRKPNPEMIWAATRALGVAPEQAWYVGDHFDRDVVCGRRAGVGVVALMETPKTYAPPYVVRDKPTITVADPAELNEHLVASLSRV